MVTATAKKVGRFSVELSLANYEEIALARNGLLERSKVHRMVVKRVVDIEAEQHDLPGAVVKRRGFPALERCKVRSLRLVLPQTVVKKLGLPPRGKKRVRYASGQTAIRDTVKGVYVNILGRHG